MLDKKGLQHYISGFSYLINWCENRIERQNDHEIQISDNTLIALRSEHAPQLKNLHQYVIQQIRRVRHDESLLKKVLKTQPAADELSLEERIVGSLFEIVNNLDRCFSLLNMQGWKFLMSELIVHLKAVAKALDDLRQATTKLQAVVQEEKPEFNEPIAEHQREIKRILQELQ